MFHSMMLSSYIHSRYCYSASSSPILLRGLPEALQATVSEGLDQSPYVAARAGFKPATLRTQGTEPTREPPHPTVVMLWLWIAAKQITDRIREEDDKYLKLVLLWPWIQGVHFLSPSMRKGGQPSPSPSHLLTNSAWSVCSS